MLCAHGEYVDTLVALLSPRTTATSGGGAGEGAGGGGEGVAGGGEGASAASQAEGVSEAASSAWRLLQELPFSPRLVSSLSPRLPSTTPSATPSATPSTTSSDDSWRALLSPLYPLRLLYCLDILAELFPPPDLQLGPAPTSDEGGGAAVGALRGRLGYSLHERNEWRRSFILSGGLSALSRLLTPPHPPSPSDGATISLPSLLAATPRDAPASLPLRAAASRALALLAHFLLPVRRLSNDSLHANANAADGAPANVTTASGGGDDLDDDDEVDGGDGGGRSLDELALERALRADKALLRAAEEAMGGKHGALHAAMELVLSEALPSGDAAHKARSSAPPGTTSGGVSGGASGTTLGAKTEADAEALAHEAVRVLSSCLLQPNQTDTTATAHSASDGATDVTDGPPASSVASGGTLAHRSAPLTFVEWLHLEGTPNWLHAALLVACSSSLRLRVATFLFHGAQVCAHPRDRPRKLSTRPSCSAHVLCSLLRSSRARAASRTCCARSCPSSPTPPPTMPTAWSSSCSCSVSSSRRSRSRPSTPTRTTTTPPPSQRTKRRVPSPSPPPRRPPPLTSLRACSPPPLAPPLETTTLVTRVHPRRQTARTRPRRLLLRARVHRRAAVVVCCASRTRAVCCGCSPPSPSPTRPSVRAWAARSPPRCYAPARCRPSDRHAHRATPLSSRRRAVAREVVAARAVGLPRRVWPMRATAFCSPCAR
jgi:hypothetical protein